MIFFHESWTAGWKVQKPMVAIVVRLIWNHWQAMLPLFILFPDWIPLWCSRIFSPNLSTTRPIIPMACCHSTCCNATLVAHAHFQHLVPLLEGEATMEILQTCTLPKTNIAAKHGGFQSESPISFSRGLFSGAMLGSGRANGTPRKHIPQRTKGWESLMELSNHHFWVSSSLVSGVY